MIKGELLLELRSYIEAHTIKPVQVMNAAPVRMREATAAPARMKKAAVYERTEKGDIEDYIDENRQPAFSKVLFGFIDKKSVPDSEIYKKAGIDRRHFSKIRSNPDYRPGKNTVTALALALELGKRETDTLLRSAGYALSDSDTQDLVIQFCLERKIYDIGDVNSMLDYLSLKPLIGAEE